MGTVWAATHTVTRRSLALKILKPRAKQQQQRFILEARAASAVDHPNVVRIEDVFELDDGMPVMVLELLEGESFAERLAREGKLEAGALADIFAPVVSALGAAHTAGIVHRDLKPDNVFLCAGGETSGVKVLDFGIAKLSSLNELREASDALTQTGALLGTPFYMSPEQATGEPIDHRTDIWSLGIIAYQALTGVIPTAADTVGAVLKIVMTGRLAPLSSHDVDVPDDLAALIKKMLALDPADRPDDLREVLAGFQRYTDAEVIEVGLPARPADSQAGDDHTTESADVDTGLWLAERSVDEEASATDDAAAAEAVDDGQQLDDAPVSAQAATTAGATTKTVAEAGAVQKPRRWGVTVALSAAAAIALVFVARGGGDRETSAAGTAETVAVPTVSASAVPTFSEPKLGLDALEKFRLEGAHQGAVLSSASWWQTAARDFAEAGQQPGAPLRWKAAEQFTRGQAALRDGDFVSAEAAFRKGVAIEPVWPMSHAGLSAALLAQGKFEPALSAAQQAQRLDPTWWRGVICAARVLNKQDKLNDAIQEYRRALELAPESALLLSELALTYHAARLDSEAVRFAQKALAIDGDMVAVRLMLAERALESGDGKTAVDEATRAVAVAPRDIACRLALGDALTLLGQRAEAFAAYRAMLDLLGDSAAPAGVPVERVALVKELVPNDKLPPPRVTKNTGGTTVLPERSRKLKDDLLDDFGARSSAIGAEDAYD